MSRLEWVPKFGSKAIYFLLRRDNKRVDRLAFLEVGVEVGRRKKSYFFIEFWEIGRWKERAFCTQINLEKGATRV